jgi:hypothetical protein
LGKDSGTWIKSPLWQMGVFAIVLFAFLYTLMRFAGRKAETA